MVQLVFSEKGHGGIAIAMPLVVSIDVEELKRALWCLYRASYRHFDPGAVRYLAVTFLLVHLIPGDPCRAMLGERAT